MAAGLFTLVNNYLPGSDHLDKAVLNGAGLIAVLLGLACLAAPWDRLSPRAPLALAPVAFALLSVSNHYGGVSAYSYAVYFVVVFVWVGIAQPPGTSWLLVPPAAVAYLVPFLLDPDAPSNAVPSVTVAIPVCVLVGEVLARTVRRLEQSRAALDRRVRRVERLAELATGLSADLDAEHVQDRLCSGAAELVGAPGAFVARLDGGTARVVSSHGTGPAVGTVVDVPADSLRRACAEEPVGVLRTDDEVLTLLDCRAGDVEQVLAVLGGGEPGREDLDVLRLLVAQARAALRNAQTHSAVVAQRAHEQAVVDVLADGVLVLDDAGCVLACNEVGAALLGAPRDELVGSTPALPLSRDGVAVHTQAGDRWLETVATRLGDSGERVVTLRDTSRQHALDEAKDLFLATTSHELRTPLTAVKGYVHVLQRRWELLDDARRLEALGTIAERTDALIALTDHLLLGARASASRHSAARVPFDLSATVRAAAEAFAEVSERHVVRVCDDGPTHALGDPGGVAQVVAQLVENAVKYSPMGGTVEVRVRAASPFGVVEVLDDGIGLPEDAMALFTPFFQAGATNTREFGGVGLGLYIVRQLVEAQGGAVSARNRDIGGAVIGFTVPLAGEAPLPRGSSEELARTDGLV